jgi:hypothetical protein
VWLKRFTAEQLIEAKTNLFCTYSLAFPQDNDFPSEKTKSALFDPVPGGITFQFVEPKFLSCFRHCCVLTTFVTMPETPVNEYRGVVFG